MRTINENFKKLKEAEDRLNKLRKEFAKNEEELLKEIKLQKSYIEQFNNHDGITRGFGVVIREQSVDGMVKIIRMNVLKSGLLMKCMNLSINLLRKIL